MIMDTFEARCVAIAAPIPKEAPVTRAISDILKDHVFLCDTKYDQLGEKAD